MSENEAFAVQSKHGLVYCIDYPFCANTFPQTEKWGENCKICCRNKYADNGTHKELSDLFMPKEKALAFHKASVLKEQLIAEVIQQLESLDEKMLTPGCSVLLNIDVHTATINIAVIDNLIEAKKLIAAAVELTQKAAAAFIKSTPEETTEEKT